MTAIAYVANTNNLELNGLKSDLENTFINDATVLVTIYDNTGTEVSGVTWPLQMTYVLASDGNYVLGLTHDLPLVNGKLYKAFIDADGSDSNTERYGHWEFSFKAQTRTS